MFGIEKDFQNLMEQVYGPLNKDKMTEIEEVKAQIKVLEKKLSFLEELEKTKSPVEEAFKDWMGVYPPTNPSVDNIFDIRWRAFQMGYKSAQKDYKVGEYQETAQERGERVHNEMEETIRIHDGYGVVDYKPTPQTPEQVADGLKEAFREAVKQGVVSSSTKPQTLYDLIYEWWDDHFTFQKDATMHDLVDRIEEWLPTEHDTNSYKWNECIRTIREKLR